MKTSKQLERYFKGSANHRRIDILRLIDKEDAITMDQIAETLVCNPKTISMHTARLINAGLITKKYEGASVHHSLFPFGKKFINFFKTF